jgi:4a-hydroxytetrahydrobiopterin dehydratase
MTQIAPLNSSEVEEALKSLTNWSVKEDKLHAEFRFNSFTEAFAFMTKVAFAAEVAQHHPEWFNVYNRVTIDLVTHDAGNAISQNDIDLARTINSLV